MERNSISMCVFRSLQTLRRWKKHNYLILTLSCMINFEKSFEFTRRESGKKKRKVFTLSKLREARVFSRPHFSPQFNIQAHLQAIYVCNRIQMSRKQDGRLNARWKALSCYQTERVFSPYSRRAAVSGVAALSHLISSSVKRSSAAVTATQENSSPRLTSFEMHKGLFTRDRGKRRHACDFGGSSRIHVRTYSINFAADYCL